MRALAMLQVMVQPGIPPEAIPIVQSFLTTVIVIALGLPIIRALSRRFIERVPPASPAPTALPTPELSARLQRIEQAVDAIAIELERVSEAQRFLTRLQTEQRSLGAGQTSPAPESPRRGA